MSYVVLARKWRPQILTDILGQDHVTQTLQNALASGRIAQTFLFSGPRGVGKTSAARILAKALCCEATDRPTAEPCGVCNQCQAIASGSSTDVIEIDAASHTGVDNVREVIVEAVRYLPSSARYKVYIIDEVHMLSTSSFNALLKTFEEPPPHAKFILATTELHKVPVTILSRCQRYDFRLIPSRDIQQRLSEILDAEGINHDLGALSTVARLADGSMRDAQSLMEQVLAFAHERPVDTPLVRSALGVVDSALIASVFEGIFSRQPQQVLQAVEEVHNRGLGHVSFAASMVEHARDLVVASVMAKPEQAIDRPSDELQTIVEQASQQRQATLERLFELLCQVQESVGRSAQPRYALEIGLTKLAAEPPALPVAALLQRLEQLEQSLVTGPSRPSGAPGPSGAVAGPSSRFSRSSSPSRTSGPLGRGGGSSGPSSERPAGPLGRQARSSSGEERPSGPLGRRSRSTGEADRSTGPLGYSPRSQEPHHPAYRRGQDRDPGSGPSEAKAPNSSRDRSSPRSAKSPPRRTSAGPKDSDEPSPRRNKPSPTRAVVGRGRFGADDGPPPLDEPPPSDEPPPLDGPPPWLGESNNPGDVDGVQSPADPPSSRASVEARYRRFVASITEKRPALGATLHQVRPMRFEPRGVHLVCETAFDSDKLAEADVRTAIESAIDGFFGSRVPLEITRSKGSQGSADAAPRTLVEVDDEERQARIAEKIERARTRPAVKAVMSELGASISRVRVLGESGNESGE